VTRSRGTQATFALQRNKFSDGFGALAAATAFPGFSRRVREEDIGAGYAVHRGNGLVRGTATT